MRPKDGRQPFPAGSFEMARRAGRERPRSSFLCSTWSHSRSHCPVTRLELSIIREARGSVKTLAERERCPSVGGDGRERHRGVRTADCTLGWRRFSVAAGESAHALDQTDQIAIWIGELRQRN